jgi:NAD(P)-dependent dehydrogenase (short-subunit alcohol dehydrogenase family)
VLEEIQAAGKGSAEFMPVDLADFDSVRAFAAAYLATGKLLHILVNNAGCAQAGKTKEGWDVVFVTNHLGILLDVVASRRARDRRHDD